MQGIAHCALSGKRSLLTALQLNYIAGLRSGAATLGWSRHHSLNSKNWRAHALQRLGLSLQVAKWAPPDPNNFCCPEISSDCRNNNLPTGHRMGCRLTDVTLLPSFPRSTVGVCSATIREIAYDVTWLASRERAWASICSLLASTREQARCHAVLLHHTGAPGESRLDSSCYVFQHNQRQLSPTRSGSTGARSTVPSQAGGAWIAHSISRRQAQRAAQSERHYGRSPLEGRCARVPLI